MKDVMERPEIRKYTTVLLQTHSMKNTAILGVKEKIKTSWFWKQRYDKVMDL